MKQWPNIMEIDQSMNLTMIGRGLVRNVFALYGDINNTRLDYGSTICGDEDIDRLRGQKRDMYCLSWQLK